MQYGVRFSELGHSGHSDWVLLRRKRPQSEDAHVSKREGAGALKGHYMVRSSPTSYRLPSCSASFAIAADHPCAGRRAYDMLVRDWHGLNKKRGFCN
jgi:hypothetical protein